MHVLKVKEIKRVSEKMNRKMIEGWARGIQFDNDDEEDDHHKQGVGKGTISEATI